MSVVSMSQASCHQSIIILLNIRTPVTMNRNHR